MKSRTAIFALFASFLAATSISFAQEQPGADAPPPSSSGSDSSQAAASSPETPSVPAFGTAGTTTILADNQAEFDSESKQAVFTGNVRVNDPEFYIQCDKLTVFVDEQGSGMERAIAEGNVRVTHQSSAQENSDPTVGRGKRLDYYAKTGIARLTGRPQVKEGTNLHLADSEETVMILSRDGRLKTEGPSQTMIVPEGGTEDSRINPDQAAGDSTEQQ